MEGKSAFLHVDDEQADQHAGDRGERGQLAVIHEDGLRENLAEDDVEHRAAGEAEAEREAERADFAEQEAEERTDDRGYAGERGDHHGP